MSNAASLGTGFDVYEKYYKLIRYFSSVYAIVASNTFLELIIDYCIIILKQVVYRESIYFRGTHLCCVNSNQISAVILKLN